MIIWVDGVFARWGVWLLTNRGRGSAGLTAAWDSVGRSNFRQAVIPIRELDSSRVHDWTGQLASNDKALMLEMYCTEGTTIDHARRLSLSTRTLYTRLHDLQAKYIRDLDNQKTQKTITDSKLE